MSNEQICCGYSNRYRAMSMISVLLLMTKVVPPTVLNYEKQKQASRLSDVREELTWEEQGTQEEQDQRTYNAFVQWEPGRFLPHLLLCQLELQLLFVVVIGCSWPRRFEGRGVPPPWSVIEAACVAQIETAGGFYKKTRRTWNINCNTSGGRHIL